MKFKQPLVGMCLAVSLSACQQPSTIDEQIVSSSQSDQLPNIVFILADDLGYGDVGAYGATLVDTPNIDKLAAQGRMFTDAHTASAVCTPSRYALLTGEYPLRSGIPIPAREEQGAWGPVLPDDPLIIDTDKPTLSTVLQESGYKTAAIGKWHLGFTDSANDWSGPLSPGPRDVGFDYYYGMPVVNSLPPYVYVENEMIVGHDPSDPLVYVPREERNDGFEPTSVREFPPEASQKTENWFTGAKKAHELFDDEQVGTVFTEKAIEWMDANKEDPFFLYFSTTQIHHPFTPAPRFKGTSEIGLYGDFIHELDWMVGELTDYLEENNLIDNTLIIFTSDNGGMLNLGGRNAVEKGHMLNGEYLGFKFGVWEGGHRVPFIAHWPEKIKAGETSKQLISLVDMMASFASLTGQSESIPEETDGVNVLPALLGETDEEIRTELVLAPRNPRNLAFREGKWVYIGAKGSGGFGGSRPEQHAWGGAAGVNLVGGENSDMKDGQLLPDAPPAQLYDLVADPYQTTNLYHQHPEIVARMEARLNEFLPRD